ncbi:hypothetical protein PENANT_c009G03204 [Penicillium antarcticum]|uniref:Uncharacterized protein n=1 Tax=Penicillium antarcticum TaxID=416450 RepID=A0A1V6Q9C9_9EURO|nr:hypothetical protein PENANT_c009G03204 [Penicillium antarcticum]
MLIYLFTILLALPPARAGVGGWDDFSNNLATDLAPFLSLFGEQITKQYMSESTTLMDYFIFAMAPMGILTAVVSAIRVCGTASLRAFIGRAQEGAGNAEAELCSSTSRDVCELYNNGGIARVFGRPKILEVVHDPNHDFSNKSDDTAGIYTFQEFVQGKGRSIWQKEKSRKENMKQKDPESEMKQEQDTPHTVFSPNLSLNIGIKKQPDAVFKAIAVGGLILQSAVLVFAGVVTYYLRWEKNGSRPEAYACPLLIIGTVLVCGGMFYCAFLVGQSTDEDVWLRRKDKADNSSMYWIQPGNQIIGDQTFDAFSHTDCDDRLEKYTTSRRKTGPREWKLEVWTATGVTLTGFVLQFTGLRGIHSAVAVAQLGVVMVMSTARAALRMERFKADANFFAKFPDEVLGHELDWLALRIGRNIIKNDLKDDTKKEIGKDDLPLRSSSPSLSCSSKTSDRSPSIPQPRYLWRFKGTTKATNAVRISRRDPTSNMPHSAAAILLAYRTRLASLTVSSIAPARNFKTEMVEVRTESQQLATLIEATVNTMFSKAEIKKEWKEADAVSMFWGIDCTISEQPKDTTISSKDHRLYLEFNRLDTGKPWVLKSRMKLEGLLGLWTWSLKSDPAIETEDPDTGLRNSRADQIQTRRVLSTEQVVNADLPIWLGDDLNTMTEYNLPVSSDLSDLSALWKKRGDDVEQTKNPLPVTPNETLLRFFGQKAAQLSQNQVSKTSSLFSTPINGSLVSACAQEVFSSFLESILDIVDDIGPVNLQETEPFRLQNSLVTEVVRLFTEMHVGPRHEALHCVVPLMISHLKTPSSESVLAAAGKSATQQRKSDEWRKAEEMLRWVWRICIQSQSSQDTPEENGNQQPGSKHSLTELATIALGELYRWALVDTKTRPFGIDGISWLERQKPDHSESICKVIDRYVTVANGVERNEDSSADLITATKNGCLTTTLLALTRPVSNIESEQKGNALCLAAKHGWAEVVHALLELNTAPDFQNAAGRTPLSYAAVNGNVDIARDLLYWGSFPDLGCPQNRTPLSYASESGAHRIVEMLLSDIRVSPDRKDKNELTPLCWAARNARDIVVEQLLNTGKVDPDAMKSKGGTPLWWAALEGHESIVQRLLDTGKVDPDANCDDRVVMTPLSNAASKGHENIVQLLLKTGKVDPDSKTHSAFTPLHWAAMNGHQKVVKQLLETGKVNPDAIENHGDSPLSKAAHSGHEVIVKLLLETKKIDPDVKDQCGHTPLTQAAKKGHDAIVKLLLESDKVDPNAKDDWNKTPLHWAARFGQSAVVKRLLESSMVDPDAKDLQGYTPLWWARDGGHDAIVTQLLQTGKVDPDPKETCNFIEANLAARKWKTSEALVAARKRNNPPAENRDFRAMFGIKNVEAPEKTV